MTPAVGSKLGPYEVICPLRAGGMLKEAMKEMEAYGFTSSHHVICPELSSYEARFPRRFKTSPAFRDLRRSEHVPER